MIVHKLSPVRLPDNEPWRDPTLDQPIELEIDASMGAVHGVLLTLSGNGPDLKITQYRYGDHDWRFRIEEISTARETE